MEHSTILILMVVLGLFGIIIVLLKIMMNKLINKQLLENNQQELRQLKTDLQQISTNTDIDKIRLAECERKTNEFMNMATEEFELISEIIKDLPLELEKQNINVKNIPKDKKKNVTSLFTELEIFEEMQKNFPTLTQTEPKAKDKKERRNAYKRLYRRKKKINEQR